MKKFKTRRAYATNKETGVVTDLGDTIEKALEANMMVRDYEQLIIDDNPDFEITIKIEERRKAK